MTERRIESWQKPPKGEPDCPKCAGYGYDLGVNARWDVMVVCACVGDDVVLERRYPKDAAS